VELCADGDALGMQVAVFRHGEMEADFAWGEMGPLDPRPMQKDSFLCAFSCGKALAVLLVHILVDRGLLASLDDPVSRYWPAFGSAGKASITVRQVIEHKAGLANAMPSFAQDKGVGSAVRELCSFRRMVAWIAKAPPKRDDIGKEEYHAITHGWLVAGLVEKIAKAHDKRWTYETLVRELVLIPLDIVSEVAVRIPECEDMAICNGQILESRLTSIGISQKLLPQDSAGDMLGDLSDGINSLKEMGMDPRFFNDRSLRSSLLPAANTHWTARGLATFYAALANSGAIPGKGRILSEAYCKTLHAEIASKKGSSFWPCGFRCMRSATSAGSNTQVPRAFGFPGLFNNMGYCDPVEGLGIAVLVNQFDKEGLAAKKILNVVAQTLGVSGHSKDGLGVS
jgi:CubicO group peptidase (beta-lactamase class C family)